MREPDVLDIAAREHRELHRAARSLLTQDGVTDLERLNALLSSVARHEAIDRLLLYPLVGRDTYGRSSLVDRRAEQRSISDQLAKAVRSIEDPDAGPLRPILQGLHVTFIGHSDREEIEDFPHARRLSSGDERAELAQLRLTVRTRLLEQLPTVPASLRHRDAADEQLGPVQIAVVEAKRILVELDAQVPTVA